MTIISSDHKNKIQFFRNHLLCPWILKMIRRNKLLNPPDYITVKHGCANLILDEGSLQIYPIDYSLGNTLYYLMQHEGGQAASHHLLHLKLFIAASQGLLQPYKIYCSLPKVYCTKDERDGNFRNC